MGWKAIVFGLIILAIGVTIGTVISIKQIPKTAYINVNEVYNDFQFKKELEVKLNNTKLARKAILDSLNLKLNLLVKDIEITGETPEKIYRFEMVKEEYILKTERFTEDNQALTTKYNDEIWLQLNTYIKDYGNEHDYAYIFGAGGTGNIMHALKKNEITSEVSKYVNAKYNGIDQ